jgi:hypothetical protein
VVLKFSLEIGERRHLALGELVDPAVVDEPDRHRVEVMQLLPAGTPGHDEASLFQHAQVLHHAETRHLQTGLELRQRQPVLREQPVEQRPPGRVGERPEHQVVVAHAATIRD